MFIRSMLEQRALVAHNLSVGRQGAGVVRDRRAPLRAAREPSLRDRPNRSLVVRVGGAAPRRQDSRGAPCGSRSSWCPCNVRMPSGARRVGCAQLRDLTGVAISEILRRGRATIAKMQQFVKEVQGSPGYKQWIHWSHCGPTTGPSQATTAPIGLAQKHSLAGALRARLGSRMGPVGLRPSVLRRTDHTLAALCVLQVQDHYPELIHRALIFNAPPAPPAVKRREPGLPEARAARRCGRVPPARSAMMVPGQDPVATQRQAFSQLFALFSSVLNARMRSKVRVLPLGGPLDEVARLLQPRAAWSWFSQATAALDHRNLPVLNGTVEHGGV